MHIQMHTYDLFEGLRPFHRSDICIEEIVGVVIVAMTFEAYIHEQGNDASVQRSLSYF